MAKIENFITGFIKKSKPQFEKYKKYILQNDWSKISIDENLSENLFVEYIEKEHTDKKIIKSEISKYVKEKLAAQKNNIKYKSDEFKLQNELISNIVDRVKYFVKRSESDHHLKEFKTFIKECMQIISIHTDRVDFYVNTVDISDIENQEIRGEEVKFLKDVFAGVSKINDDVSNLNIKDEAEAANSIEFRDGVKAPLSMHKVLAGGDKPLFPEINRRLKELKIDFDSPPNNEMLIYMDKVPEWNPDKHYWEQDKNTLQFYVDEFKKLENGIDIDGVYISGWAYYHMNVFVTPIPHKVWNEVKKEYQSKDRITNPPLRDSDWMLFENRALQEKLQILFMFVAATRRAAKTTAEASMLGHAATIGKAELLCAGASGKDLGQLAKNFKTDILHKNPAFAVYNVTNDWDKEVEMGIKRKNGKTIPLSKLFIINTDNGNSKEVYAGFTPDIVVLDEAMKEKFLEALEGLLPAMKGADGMIRCFGMLSGTGGTDALSADGLKVLGDPETYDILPMQWDILERGVPEDQWTWYEDRLKPFGTFIPGQCRVDMPKIESTLADYLGKPESAALKKIKINITDWKKSVEIIEERRDKVIKDKIKYQKEIVYAPLSPSQIFMSGKGTRFPVAEAKAHKQYLLETGKWDRRRELYRDSQGNIQVEVSTKPLAPFPHRGGNIDAPFLIFEDIPKEKPKYGMYSAGFDDYAAESSDTASLASFYIIKNSVIGDPFSNKIVASISFRPNKHKEVYEKWLMLMEAYNLEDTCFGENFNYAIKDFLEIRHLDTKYLASSLDFSASFSIPNNGRRKTGWNPSTSKKFLFDLFVDYCNETFEIEQEDGTLLILKGVQLIDDIGLLDEIIQWSENLNVDRITSAMGAVAHAHYMRSSYKWKPLNYVKPDSQNEKPKESKERPKTFYAQNKRNVSFYNRPRR